MIFEVAHHMALVPVLWLAIRRRQNGAAWWWLSGIFLVSWVADWASHWADSWLVGLVYPITQAAIVAAVFLSRRDATLLVLALVVVGSADAFWQQASGPDIMLRTVAWGSAALVVFPLWATGRLRSALLVTFAGGLLTWWGYTIWPGWTSYLIYQGTRLLGILLFCRASLETAPHFKLSTARQTGTRG